MGLLDDYYQDYNKLPAETKKDQNECVENLEKSFKLMVDFQKETIKTQEYNISNFDKMLKKIDLKGFKPVIIEAFETLTRSYISIKVGLLGYVNSCIGKSAQLLKLIHDKVECLALISAFFADSQAKLNEIMKELEMLKLACDNFKVIVEKNAGTLQKRKLLKIALCAAMIIAGFGLLVFIGVYSAAVGTAVSAALAASGLTLTKAGVVFVGALILKSVAVPTLIASSVATLGLLVAWKERKSIIENTKRVEKLKGLANEIEKHAELIQTDLSRLQSTFAMYILETKLVENFEILLKDLLTVRAALISG